MQLVRLPSNPKSYIVWIDTHAHLTDPQLQEDSSRWLEAARNASVAQMISVATDHASTLDCLRLAQRQAAVVATAGVHPNSCHEASTEQWEALVDLARSRPEVVALGETGLDRYWDFAPFDSQVEWFERHIQLSLEIQKPLVIHMRDCVADILDCLERFKGQPLRGVMHSYSEDRQWLERFLDLGLYISFSGMVTFKKNDKLRQVARQVPRDRILIETDSPYLSPHPFRGQRPNHPALVVETGKCLANVLEIEEAEFAAITTQNARNLFALGA